MPFETERLIHDNPPTSEQLHALAAIGTRSAISRGRFRSPARIPKSHYYVEELDLLADTPMMDDDSPTQVYHRVAMRVGARPPQGRDGKTWSLKYFDKYSVEATPGVWREELSQYRFEWTRSKILVAEHTLRLVGFEPMYDKDDLYEQLEHFRLRDDDAAILEIQEELRTVSEADCDELMKDMSNYFSVVEATNR